MTSIRISLCLLLSLPLAAQSAITTNVVVKDRRGLAVKGLTADQFSLSDNGTKVSGLNVRMVDTAESPKLVTLVFEQMDNEQRRLARMIANDMVKESKDGHRFAVFIFANQLCLLQTFTADREALRAAIELATSGALNTRFADVHAQSMARLRGAADELSRVQLRMTSDLRFANEEGSRRAVAFLDSIARGLGTAPGRKAVAYLTWGMFVPAFLDVPFQALQARANRGGVSFYGIDCRGVQVNAQNRAVDQAAGSASTPGSGGIENSATVNFRAVDNIQDNLRLNLQANLRVLSETTGGLFVGDTNDPKPAVRQLLDDSSTYYELSYDPGVTEYNGAYRKTSVTVAAKDARVRDRDGYLALRADQQDLLPYELSMLEALGRTPLPRDVDFRSGAIRLQQRADSVSASVLVEVPFAGLAIKEDSASGQYLARLTMLVQIKDATGKVVQRFSRDLPLKGKLEQLPALKASNFSFREQFSGPPGRYTVEAVVTDQLGGKAAARRSAFTAAAKAAGLSMSSISMVRSFVPNAKDLTPEEPFQFQGGRIAPTFQTTLKQVKGAQMALFFTVYPEAGAAPPQATVKYLKDGTVVGNVTLPLPAADAQGRVPYVLSSPIDAMPAGTYEVKVSIQQGTATAQESVIVTIES
jgi:VWFA-related protein